MTIGPSALNHMQPVTFSSGQNTADNVASHRIAYDETNPSSDQDTKYNYNSGGMNTLAQYGGLIQKP